MIWIKELVIFFFWAYKEFKQLQKDYKCNKEAQCTPEEVEQFIKTEKEKENAK